MEAPTLASTAVVAEVDEGPPLVSAQVLMVDYE